MSKPLGTEDKIKINPPLEEPGPSNDGKGEQVTSGISGHRLMNKKFTMDDATKNLMTFLNEINGQDAYSPEAAASGKLDRRRWLALPRGYVIPPVKPEDVGNSVVHMEFSYELLWQIYALNKARCSSETCNVIYGFIRMEAVKMGWVDNQKEVEYVDPIDMDEAARIFTEDMQTKRGQFETFRAAAFLIPLMAEHVFRTTGHHFLTVDQVVYVDKYKQMAKAALLPDMIDLMPPSVMLHEVLHWVSPSRSRSVLMSQLNEQRIPDCITLRAFAAPAGTAIVTTTCAVLDALRSTNMYNTLVESGIYNVTELMNVRKIVQMNPATYHKSYYAYNAQPPTPADKERLDNAKKIAESFAPIAQGFIDTYLKTAALGKARALKKYADNDPSTYNKAKMYFRALKSEKPVSFLNLIKGGGDNVVESKLEVLDLTEDE